MPNKEIEGVANVNSTREFNSSDRGLCNHNTGVVNVFLVIFGDRPLRTSACDTIVKNALRGASGR